MSEPTNDRTRRSYQAGGRIARERIARENPSHHEALEAVKASDVIVVRGSYDHVEMVLDVIGVPHSTIDPGQVAHLTLRPDQLLVIDCPGEIGRRGVDVVRRFVEAGGSLFTTDWALRHVLEPAFPGVVYYNERPTADAAVRIEIAAHDNPFLDGVFDQGDDPQWWLEGSSYPIVIDDPERVQVLIHSTELAAKWGEAPVAITFRHGEGEVFHMISHYYLQRTELRTDRHKTSATDYAMAKDVAPAPDLDGLDYGEVESASSSARMVSNLIAAKKRAAMDAARTKSKESS